MNNEQQAARDAARGEAYRKWYAKSDRAYPFESGFDAGYAARDAEDAWVAERPGFACVFVGKRGDDYSLWELAWTQAEGDFDEEDFDNGTIHYCLIWTESDGEEYDDIEECNFDQYLVIAKRPTMDEVHAETIQRMKARLEREMQPTEGE